MKQFIYCLSVLMLMSAFSFAQTPTNEQLIQYKKGFPEPTNGHKLFFGWFNGDAWSAEPGVAGNCLADLPDSLDCVSLWLFFGAQSDAVKEQRRKDDIAKIKAKGTRVFLSFRVGGLTSNKPKGGLQGERNYSENDNGLEQYCEDIYQTCLKYGLNGFDWGHEDSGYVKNNTGKFIGKLREKFNKHNQEHPDEMDQMYLCVNIPDIEQDSWSGFFTDISPDDCKKIDLFLWQTYDIPFKVSDGSHNYSQSTVQKYINSVKGKNSSASAHVIKRSIMTADFELGARRPNLMNQVKSGKNTEIAGFGVYRIQLDHRYYPQIPYATVRRAIQILNPAEKYR